MKSLTALFDRPSFERARFDRIRWSRLRPGQFRVPELSRRWTIALACLGVVLTGCGVMLPLGGGSTGDRDGPGDSRIAAYGVSEAVRNLPKSKRGNMQEYTVRGQTYRTLASAEGYRESGVASWYGRKFHGRETSSGEPFDMHAMTAAHKSLPLPTFVRVTHRGTGDSIIVKVNDRGPFAHDRLIDLSYAAALHLGVLEHGTAEVEIEALSTHLKVDAGATAPVDAAAVIVAESVEQATPVRRVETTATVATGAREPSLKVVDAFGPGTVSGQRALTGPGTLQLGAFREMDNAEALMQRAAPHLATTPRVVHDSTRDLYRVRVGPLADAAALDAALAGLETAGIDSYKLLAATP